LFTSIVRRGLAALAGALLLTALLAPHADAQSGKATPRNINDILKVLEHYKPDPAAVAKAQAELNQAPPQSADQRVLRDFYLQRARAADKLGAAAQSVADLNQALRYFGEREGDRFQVMRQLATAEAFNGNFLAALKLNEEVAQRSRPGSGFVIGAHQHTASIASNLGDIDGAERALSRAEDTHRQAQRSPAMKLNEHNWTGAIERARAEVFRAKGKWADAEKALEAALKAQVADRPFFEERLRQNPTAFTDEGYARVLETTKFNLARVQQRAGRLQMAERTQREALQAALERVGRYHVETGRHVLALASIIADQGRAAESEVLAREAVSILEKSGVPDSSLWLAEARRALATSLVTSDKYPEALKVFESLRAGLARDPAALARYSTDDLDWVHALLKTAQYKPAADMALRLRDKSRSDLGDRDGRTAMIRCFYASALYGLGDLARAGPEYGECIGPFLEWARSEGMSGNATIRTNVRRTLVLEFNIDMQARNFREGRAARGPSPVVQSFRFADIARGSKVQGALNASAARASISDPALAELARREQDAQLQVRELQNTLREQLALAPDQQVPAAIAKMRADSEALRKERSDIRAQIEQRFPEYADLTSPRPPAVEDIQKALLPGEVMVSVYLAEKSGYIWAIPRQGPATMAALPVGASEVGKTVATLRKALDAQASGIDEIPPYDVALAARLYEQVFKPVEAAWKDAKSLLYVPHGPLGALPIGLLPTEPVRLTKGALPFEEYKAVPWLSRKIALTQLPSVRALTGLRRAPPPKGERRLYLGIGDPFFSAEQAAEAARAAPVMLASASATTSRGAPVQLRSAPKTMGVEAAELALLPRLPDTSEELLAIAKALGADPARDVVLHKDANEKRITGMKLDDRRIIHFATHGLVPGELEGLTQPALALTAPEVAGVDGDGLLTMEEILGLKLNADWVVLSACNTASGAGEGAEALSGLGSAFFYAGARALLVSNWPVDSVASRVLMSDLFKRYASGPAQSKAESLRQAMLALMDGPGFIAPDTGKPAFSYAHPLFWAPFVLVGD
jgi:CHAT domain-containing protein